MSSFLRSQWFVIAFVLFLPLFIFIFFVDFIRESEFFSRIGWFLLLSGLAYLLNMGKRRIFFNTILWLFVIFGAFDIAYAIVFGGVFTAGTLEAFLNTDSGEALEFLQAYFDPTALFFLMVYVGIAYYSIGRYQVAQPLNLQRKVAIAMSFLMVAVSVQQIYKWNRTFDTLPGSIGKSIDYAMGREVFEEVLVKKQAVFEASEFKAELKNGQKQTYVVIIGESMSRAHMSAYGYERKTTPFIDALRNVMVFKDVVSPFAQTTPSLTKALTESSMAQHVDFTQAATVAGLAKKAGFKLFWLSNQQPLRIPTTSMARLADKSVYLDREFFGVENNRYDSYLLPHIRDAIKDEAQHKMIFVHLMGSHLHYESRYPDEDSVFSGDEGINAFTKTDELSNRQIEFINHYDNTIAFTDKLVEHVHTELVKQDGISSFVLFSDHGEEVFQNIDFVGHRPNSVTKNMIEVPFLVWTNERYQASFTDTFSELQQNTSSPFMIDRFFNFFICWANLKTDDFSDQSTLCHQEGFESSPRLVYGRKYPEEY